MINRVRHWIAGRPWPSTAERQGVLYDPENGTVTGQVDYASVAEVDRAVSAATAAFTRWRSTSIAKRTQILFAFRELLHDRRDELATIIVAEHGLRRHRPGLR